MNDDTMEAAARLMSGADRLVAIGHVNPDGDALGSALALAIAARDAGKEAWVTFGEPFSIPDQYRFLDLEPVVGAAEIPDRVDVAVACDTANPERLGGAQAIAERAEHLVVIDHHPSNGGFGDLQILDATAAATAQLLYYLVVDHLAWPLSAAAATALYTGLVTDTGRFQYSATTPEVHRVAAELLRAGVDPDEVGRHIYGEAPFGYLHVAGAVLGRAELEADTGLVWSVVYESDLEAAGIGYADVDGLIDLVRLAAEAEVACLLKETGSGVLKASLRSRGTVDVNALAARFGGGGHERAAGFTAFGTVAEVMDLVKDALK